MSAWQHFAVGLLVVWYALLLRLYPRRFREQFGEEMAAVFANVLEEAARRGAPALIRVWMREMLAAPVNLLQAYLNSWRRQKVAASERPGWLFLGSWTFVSMFSPGCVFIGALLFIPLLHRLLGPVVVRYGHRVPTEDLLLHFIFFPALGLILGSIQALLLRRYLPGAWRWTVAIVAGWLAFTLAQEVTMALNYLADIRLEETPQTVVMFLALGLVSGVLQWLFFRRTLPGAAWFFVANLLVATLVPLAGELWQRAFGLGLAGPLSALGLMLGFASGLTVMLLLRAQGGSPNGETVGGGKMVGELHSERVAA